MVLLVLHCTKSLKRIWTLRNDTTLRKKEIHFHSKLMKNASLYMYVKVDEDNKEFQTYL